MAIVHAETACRPAAGQLARCASQPPKETCFFFVSEYSTNKNYLGFLNAIVEFAISTIVTPMDPAIPS